MTITQNDGGNQMTIDLSNAVRECIPCHGTGIRFDRTFPEPCSPRAELDPAARIVCAESRERIRKNGTCSAHACYYCDGNKVLTARQAFCAAVSREVTRIDGGDEAAMDAEWRELADAIRRDGKAVSAAKAWQNAVSWFGAELRDEQNAQSARWIVLQGSVWLGHASV